MNNLIVLDDCFNSMDVPNRTFMMTYLLRKTTHMQKIVLTHNTGFFNLFKYIANNSEYEGVIWKEMQLCKINGMHTLINGSEKKIEDIKKDFANMEPSVIGNNLRQQFEILILELTRINNIGELQETKDLLDKLCSSNSHVYLSIKNGKYQDIYSLVDEIYANVTNGNYTNLQKRLKKKIEEFRTHDFLETLKPVLKELRLLQKVTLHQSSHGHIGLPPISTNEIKVCLALLEKLEKSIQSVKNRVDVSSV
jgi:hypothetical protein